jgi:outer membrane protein OmpA-like peptidoglycan-associated protein
MKKILIPALILVTMMSATSQDNTSTMRNAPRVGVLIGGSYNLHSSSFVDLPGMQSCCPEYTSGAGIGAYFGAEYSLPLSRQWRLSFRADLSMMPGTFTEEEFIGYALEGSGDNARVVRGVTEHEVKTTLTALEIIPRIGFMPFDDLNLGFHAFVDAALIMGGTYESQERLISPASSRFFDTGNDIRNQASGDITNLQTLMVSIGGGVHYDFQLSETFFLTPELSYYQGLTNVVDFSAGGRGDAWKASSIRAGVVLGFAFVSTMTEQPPMKTLGLVATLDAKELRADNTEADIAKVLVEETLSTQVYPLLPYIFFDDGVSTMNTNTYRNLTPAQARQFNENTAFTFDNTAAPSREEVNLDVYYNVLNVIGKRMRDQYPQASLTLTGCSSERGSEQRNAVIGQNRADDVRDYLVRVWNIDIGRIKVEGRGLPQRASKYTVTDPADLEDAIEENRRVEIASSMPEVLFPVVVNDTLREITPPRIRFRMGARSDTAMATWKLTAVHPVTPASITTGSAFLKEQGSGAPPPEITWARAMSQREIPRTADPIISVMEVEDKAGNRATAADTMAVDLITIERKKREKIGNYEVDRYRLALFEYEETELNALHQQIVDRYIKPSLPPNAIVEIDGYTDRKGATSLNERLSGQRANTVARALGVEGRATVTAHGEGSTSDKPPFDNVTAEGRMYNRTVNVTVKIPSQ